MNKTRKLYSKRTFLNPERHGGLAAIDAEVSVRESDTDISVSASLGFSDCSNQIYLDFDVWDSSATKRVLKERRQKLEHIKTIVGAFIEACEEAYNEVEQKYPEKQHAAAEKEKKKKKQ